MYVPQLSALGATDMTPVKMSTQDKAELLEASAWTHDFNWPQVLALAAYTQVFRVRAEHVVFREHDRNGYMCLVLDGQVGVFKEDSELGKKELARLGPGKAFGELALLDGQPRSATIAASMDTRVLVLSHEALKQVCQDHPKLGNALLWVLVRVIAGRLRATSGALVEAL